MVYNVQGLEADLKAYEKAAMKNFTDEEQNLVANVFNAIDAAKEEIKAKRIEEGQEQIAEAKELVIESEEMIAPDVLDLFVRNVDAAPGDLRYRDVTVEESLGRDNYRQADNIDYLDGDFQSSIKYSDEEFNSPARKMKRCMATPQRASSIIARASTKAADGMTEATGLSPARAVLWMKTNLLLPLVSAVRWTAWDPKHSIAHANGS